MKSVILFSVVLWLLLLSCSGTNRLNLKDNPNCQSIVKGKFVDEFVWRGKVPAIVMESFRGYATKYGKILSVSETGIRFDGDKEGPLANPGAKDYAFKDLICVINENREVIHGEVPKRYKVLWELCLSIINIDRPDLKKMKITLKQGEDFAFCLPPGNYEIVKIIFTQKIRNQMNTSYSTHLPELNFTVTGNCVNYLGEISFNVHPADAPNTCVLPYKYPAKMAIYTGSSFGLIASMVGSAVYNMMGMEYYHTITVHEPADLSAKAGSGLPVKLSLLQFDNSENKNSPKEFETIKIPQAK